jgi:hypothetical protein
MGGMEAEPVDEAGPLWIALETALESMPFWARIAVFGSVVLALVVAATLFVRWIRNG